MDPVLIAGGVFAAAVIVLADRADAIVDRFSSSDDPLTDFDAEFDEDTDDGTDPFNDA
jgi:hypothetical protein